LDRLALIVAELQLFSELLNNFGGFVIITRPRRSDDDDGVLGEELRVEF
jgi:hypothetical protein